MLNGTNNMNQGYQPVNLAAIAETFNTSSAINDKADAAKGDPSKITTIHTAEPYEWAEEVVTRSLFWDTKKISHLIKMILDQVFDDVESVYVYADPTDPLKQRVLANVYFSFMGEKKTENGLLAFSGNPSKSADVAMQFAQAVMMQKNGPVNMTREAMEIFSAFIFIGNNSPVNKKSADFINKIRWNEYVKFTPSKSNKYGISIELSKLDVTEMLYLIIPPVDANGNYSEDKDRTKHIITIRPGPEVADDPKHERYFEIIIGDLEKLNKIYSKTTNGVFMMNSFTGVNPYVSFT